jgi:hypothetical protein
MFLRLKRKKRPGFPSSLPDHKQNLDNHKRHQQAREGVLQDSPALERPETAVFPLAHIGEKSKPLVTAEERALILRYDS